MKHHSHSHRLCAVFLTLLLIVPAAPLRAQAMTTAGAFRVSETGAAVYEIPLRVPPGTAGMEPKLSLAYNSQGGNGLLGMGWSLSGLSAVTRCPRTQAQDGVRGGVFFDANDRFCLDGQRLIAIAGTYGANGTEYRTERDSFTRIFSWGVAGTGPAWFEASTKSGLNIQFGNTADSRAEAQGKTSVRTYAVNKITDVMGNYLTVTYIEDSANGDHYPSRIDYTGNAAAGLTPSLSVQFLYETRTDITALYHAGSVMKTMKRLINVQTFNDTSLVKDYRLAYATSSSTGRSRVTSIAECGAFGTCLPALTPQWQNSSESFLAKVLDTHATGTWATDWKILEVDVNGDGKMDVVASYTDSSGWRTHTALSNGDGTFGAAVLDTHATGVWATDWRILTADVNGDGKTDLIATYTDSSGWRTQTVLSNGDGTFAPPVLDIHSTAVWASNVPILVGDVNGDGKIDLIASATDSAGWRALTVLGNGDGTFGNVTIDWHDTGVWATDWKVFPADVNGDGKTDLVASYTDNGGWRTRVVTSNGDGTFGPMISDTHSVSSWAIGVPIVIGDVNGDGKVDLIATVTDGSGWRSLTVIGLGDGTFGNLVTDWHDTAAWATDWKVLPADANGDSKTDLIAAYTDGSGWRTKTVLSNGDGTFGAITTVTHDTTAMALDWKIMAADFSGDGRADVVASYTDSAGWRTLASLRAGPFPDLLASLTTGLGAAITLTHKPLTDSTVYTKDATATYPTIDYQGAVYVVSAYTTSNGIGGTYQMTYNYTGAKIDVNGRGFLGFRIVQAADPLTLKTITTNRQDWPYIGLPSQVKRTTSGGAVITQVDNTFLCKDLDADPDNCTIAAGKRYFPYVSQALELNNDLNGAFMTKVRTTNTFDSYGNPLTIVVTHLNQNDSLTGYSKTTTNAYTNTTTGGAWLLGRLTQSTLLSATP